MIRSCCLLVAGVASVVALSACAAGGGDDDGDGGRSGYGGGGNAPGFGGNAGSGNAGSGNAGSSFGGSSGSSSVGGSSGSSSFGGTSGSSSVGGTSGSSSFGGTNGSSSFGGTTGTGTGGSTGAGTGGSGTGAVAGVTDLIDDMESGTGSILAKSGRVGAWYTYNDKTATGMQTPPAGGTSFPMDPGGFNGTKCARTNGSGFTVWGAGMGFDLNNTGTAKGIWNASAFQGIAFQAKSTTPFRIKVLIPATTPTAEGGTCTGAGCSNNHGFIVPASPSWAPVTVPFSSLTQETWAEVNTAAFSSAAIIGIQFQVVKDAAFDVAIDNIGFY